MLRCFYAFFSSTLKPVGPPKSISKSPIWRISLRSESASLSWRPSRLPPYGIFAILESYERNSFIWYTTRFAIILFGILLALLVFFLFIFFGKCKRYRKKVFKGLSGKKLNAFVWNMSHFHQFNHGYFSFKWKVI